MKKILFTFLMVIAGFTFVGCGSSEEAVIETEAGTTLVDSVEIAVPDTLEVIITPDEIKDPKQVKEQKGNEDKDD